MAIKTRDELFGTFKSFLGEELGDDKISFLEDFTDTFNALDEKAKGDGIDWKRKYEENDSMWKQKYTDRFFAPVTPEPEKTNPQNVDISINDLFK